MTDGEREAIRVVVLDELIDVVRETASDVAAEEGRRGPGSFALSMLRRNLERRRDKLVRRADELNAGGEGRQEG